MVPHPPPPPPRSREMLFINRWLLFEFVGKKPNFRWMQFSDVDVYTRQKTEWCASHMFASRIGLFNCSSGNLQEELNSISVFLHQLLTEILSFVGKPIGSQSSYPWNIRKIYSCGFTYFPACLGTAVVFEDCVGGWRTHVPWYSM